MDRVIGIDLGTTNCCVAILDERGVPTVIPNKGGYKTTPSMVALTESGKRLVGHIAKRQAVTNAEHTVTAAKRLIGRKWTSPQARNVRRTSSFKIVEGPHGDPRIVLRDKTYSVPEISGMVLAEMKSIAEAHLGETVRKAVVTVPAYFNDGQRQATKDAGGIAGLDVIRILNEPTAAALSYGFGREIEKTIAVFDLGGGTFDISILEIVPPDVFKVVATAGDSFLGGEDFDARIVDWLLAEIQREHGLDVRSDRLALQRLKDAAEKAKCELSTQRDTEINLPFLVSSDRAEALHLRRTLTRDQLEILCEDLIERTLDTCRDTLADAQLGTEDIEEVVLVGGMTRMPKIQRSVAELFEREPFKGVHPDEVVALGAAIQGASLAGQSREATLLDVTSHAIGLLTFGDGFEELIAKNTTIPAFATKVFTTSRDRQTEVRIAVVQRASEGSTEHERLGEFLLTGLRSAPKGQVVLEVTFEINADGIVSVRALDADTGLEQSIQITANGDLTRDEVRGMNLGAAEPRSERPSEKKEKPTEKKDVQAERKEGPSENRVKVAEKKDPALEAARREVERSVVELEPLFARAREAVRPGDARRGAIEDAEARANKALRTLDQMSLAELKEQLGMLARTQRLIERMVPTR